MNYAFISVSLGTNYLNFPLSEMSLIVKDIFAGYRIWIGIFFQEFKNDVPLSFELYDS